LWASKFSIVAIKAWNFSIDVTPPSGSPITFLGKIYVSFSATCGCQAASAHIKPFDTRWRRRRVCPNPAGVWKRALSRWGCPNRQLCAWPRISGDKSHRAWGIANNCWFDSNFGSKL
jgi:hypothetical protein